MLYQNCIQSWNLLFIVQLNKKRKLIFLGLKNKENEFVFWAKKQIFDLKGNKMFALRKYSQSG